MVITVTSGIVRNVGDCSFLIYDKAFFNDLISLSICWKEYLCSPESTPQIVGVDSLPHSPECAPRFHQNLQSSESDFEIRLLHYDGFVWLVWPLISVLKNLSLS